MLVDKFDKNGIVKANKIITTLEKPVKYKDLNFWKLILVNGFFLKLNLEMITIFVILKTDYIKVFFINLLNNIFFKLPPPLLPLVYNDITSFEHLV